MTDIDQRVLELNEKLPPKEIAKIVCRETTTIYHILKKHGVEIKHSQKPGRRSRLGNTKHVEGVKSDKDLLLTIKGLKVIYDNAIISESRKTYIETQLAIYAKRLKDEHGKEIDPFAVVYRPVWNPKTKANEYVGV